MLNIDVHHRSVIIFMKNEHCPSSYLFITDVVVKNRCNALLLK